MKEGMRKFLISVFVLVMAFSVVIGPFFEIGEVDAQEEGSWITLSPLPITRTQLYYTGTAALNGKIYYIDGNMTMRYNPETNNWAELAPLPILNPGGVVAACQNKIYVVGGSADVSTQVYDPDTDTWENRTSTHGTSGYVQANVVNGKIYVMGGQYPSFPSIIVPVSSNYVYDPETDTWSQMAPIPVGVGGYASAVLNDKIYIISGGYEAAPDYNPTNLVQIFDPTTNHWTNGTSIPTAVYAAGACVITGPSGSKRIYVIGGQLGYFWYYLPFVDGVDLNQVYDLETDTWTNAMELPTPRTDLGVAVINNEIYAIGGESNGTYLTVNEKYSPTDSIPEFPSWVVLPLFLVATLFVVVIRNRIFRSSSQ